MARLFALSRRFFLLVTVASLTSGFPALLAAPPAPATTNAPTTNATPPSTPNKPGAPMAPPAHPVPPQDPFNRYGNILQPGVEPSHPLRLALPFPDVGEIKMPTQDELTMREKLEQLAMLSDDQIRQQLFKWPPFTKMSLKDEAMMLARIQDFRERRARIAQQEAHDIGLLTLTPEQEARFEKEYWNKRLPMERDLAKQIEPLIKARETKLSEDLYREFSEPNGPLTQNAAKPPTPAKPAPVKVTDKPAAPPPPTQTAQAGTNSAPAAMH